MKVKHALTIFLVGILVSIFGAFLKITHFSFGPITGNITLIIGSVLETIGILVLIFKVYTSLKLKDFLNQ